MSNRNHAASKEILERLAHNLQRLLKERGITRRQLAARTGLGTAYIRRVEDAKVNITLNHLEIIANVLNCRLRDLVARIRTP